MGRFPYLTAGRCRLLSDTINWALYGRIEDVRLGVDAGFNAYYGDLFGSGEETFPRHMAHRSIDFQKANLEVNREHIRELKGSGIAYIYYSSSCTFDQTFFDEATVGRFAAVFQEFKWAFGTVNRRFACFNSPEWLDFQVEKTRMLITELDVEGVFFDNIFYHPCICDNCCRKYRQAAGKDLKTTIRELAVKDIDEKLHEAGGGRKAPARLDPGLASYYGELLVYSQWRLACMVDFFKEYRRRVESESGRGFVVLGNTYLNSAEGMMLYRSGVFDAYYSENGFSYPPESNGFTHKIGQALEPGEDKAAIVVTRVQEGMPTPGMVKVFLAEGAANQGCSTPWGFYVHESQQVRDAAVQYVNFFKAHETLLAGRKNLADVAVVMPARSGILKMMLGDDAQYLTSGCCIASRMLSDLHIPHDILFAEDIFTKERLARYRMLIFPEADIFPEENYRLLEQFAERGGTVLATGDSFVLDENLRRRERVLKGPRVYFLEKAFDRRYITRRLSDDYEIKDRMKKFNELQTLAEINPSGLLDVQAGPMTCVTLSAASDGLLVHLVNYNINHGPYSIRVICDTDVQIRIALSAKVTEIVRFSPDDAEGTSQKLDFSQKGGRVEFRIPELQHYCMVWVKTEEPLRF